MKKFFTIGIKKIFSIETIEERIEKGIIAMEEKKKKDFSSIGKPIKIGDFFVAQYDFPSMMNWQDAKKACEALGNYWRLPNVDELNFYLKIRIKLEVLRRSAIGVLRSTTASRVPSISSMAFSMTTLRTTLTMFVP